MFSKLLRRIGIEGTPHGMRSSFRDWCSETGVAREVAEAALAHKVRSQAEAAYARSDLLDRRREVMEAWGAYLAADAGTRRPNRPAEALAHDRLPVMSSLPDAIHRGMAREWLRPPSPQARAPAELAGRGLRPLSERAARQASRVRGPAGGDR